MSGGVRRRAVGAASLVAMLMVVPIGCSHGSQDRAGANAPRHEPARSPVEWTWTPRTADSFVPQGLARADGRLYLTGYRWSPRPADRRCEVLVLDASDGSRLARATELRDPAVAGSTAGGPVCHHGGGAAYSPEGLWIAGSGRLWLVDPRRPATVLRSWAVDPGIRASTVAVSEGRLWLAKYSMHGRGRLARVQVDDLVAPGVTRLSGQPGPGAARAVVRPAPNFVQGIAIDDRGVWLSRSSTRCGDLVRPHGGHRKLIPGAEGVLLVGRHRAWVVSESGAPHYQRLGGRPDVPMLSLVDLRELPEGRCFRA